MKEHEQKAKEIGERSITEGLDSATVMLLLQRLSDETNYKFEPEIRAAFTQGLAAATAERKGNV